MAQDKRILKAIQDHGLKTGKLVKKVKRAIHPKDVLDKKKFELSPFIYTNLK